MERKEIEQKYLWKIEDLYKTQEEFDADVKRAESLMDFSKYQGKLSDEKVMLEYFTLTDKVAMVIERLYVYAMMKVDTDTRDSSANKLLAIAEKLSVSFSSKIAFAVPEILALDKKMLNEIKDKKEFSEYSYSLKTLIDKKEHILSAEQEKILASLGEVTSTFKEIFSKIDNADLSVKPVKHKGKTYEISHGTYSVLLQNEDRALRKKAFKNYYDAYISVINTISSNYRGLVKKNVFYAKTRGYEDCLSMALKGEDVDKKVYLNLLNSVSKALPTLHKYVSIKKKTLGVNTMHMYDMYVPLVAGADLKMEYEDAYNYVIKALSPLGEKYADLLKTAYTDGWIDVKETTGKRSGAYSVSVYDCHPFVLLNYQKTTHDIFTIAHEMGHAIHSYFSNKNQPYPKADYRIFVAEVASTVNEVLLHRYMLSTVKDKALKKYVLSYFLEMIRTTLFRQTQFAEFEYITHKTEFDGEPLTKDFLCKTYHDLNKKYYGKSVVSDDEIAYEWARIPHFYSAFYVYKYSTGIISALSIADRILTEGESAVKDYFKFLSSGSSDGPVELLKIAGVDLTTKTPFEKAMNTFKNYLKEFENL